MTAAARTPLEVELLVDRHARRVTIDDVVAFRESITPKPEADEIDDFLTELRELKPEGFNP